MTKAELIERLSKYPDDMQVMIRDSYHVLDLNFGPISYTISDQDEEYTGDCDGRVGEQVIVIGGGSY